MLKILIVLLFLKFASPVYALSADSVKSPSGPRGVFSDTARIHYPVDPDKPKFPPEDQIRNIKEKREVARQSGINVYFGFARTFKNNSDISESFDNIESAFGFSDPQTFPDLGNSFTMGMRYRFVKNFGLLWEYLYAGKPSDNQCRLSSTSLSAMFTFFPDKILSPSLGVGVATQKIKAMRIYSRGISNGARLDKIDFDTGPHWGVPLTALLEFKPIPADAKFALFAAMRYVYGQKISVDQQVNGTEILSTFKIDMSNSRFTAGIAIGL